MSKTVDKNIKQEQFSQEAQLQGQDDGYQSVLHKIEAPPTNFNFKQNALEYDIKLGWIPRSQITGPIPLSFTHNIIDAVFQQKAKSFIYLGYRPRHSFQLHERYYQKGKNYPFYQFHLCKSQFLDRFFKKYYGQYEFNGCRQPSKMGEAPIEFNSDFEGGNLDGVYFQESQYRLLLRVDSNTQGHCNYYNFRVKANEPGRYAFRIMNITKNKSLYQRGMSPYVRFLKDGKWTEFKQCNSKVKFSDSPLCDQYEVTSKLKSLYFQYTFTYQASEYEFSYTIPYTYSNLLNFLNNWRQSSYMHLTKLCHTLSGVEVPLLTITSPNRQEETNQPFVVVITGRVHPSEANGSFIVEGIINTLLGNSQSGKFLRKNVIFKIIPMLNPDGVIMGNTRTSFSGKDLNRRYYKNSQFVYPQIIGVMDYVAKLKSKYNNKLLYIIDIHGHSARKNSFFYGPEFSIIDIQYTRCRLLPRIYSQKTDVFRYYSCKYKVATSKQNSARGYFNTNGIRAYTHQTSMHCYWNFKDKKDEPFTRKTYEKLGQNLVDTIAEYIRNQPIVAKYSRQQLADKQKQFQRSVSKTKGIDFEQNSDDSQEMNSSRDDSEDESEDFQDKKLQQFYNRINQNKQYFIQQLEAMERNQTDKKQKEKPKNQQKKRKTSQLSLKTETQIVQQQGHKNIQKRQKLENEIIIKKTIEKVDWVAKVAYPQRKKTHQQYTKMSSVIFGSSIPPSYFSNSLSNPTSRSHINSFATTKYSIKCIEAEFKSTAVKYPSPEPKVYHSNKPIIRQNSLKDTEISRQLQKQKEQQAQRQQKLQQLKRERFKQIKQQSQVEIDYQPKRIAKSQIERLLSKPSQYCILKQLPVYSVDLHVEKQQQQKLIKNLNSSLKVLTRKKSIKSIRQTMNPSVNSRYSKQKGVSLNKLPSINNVLNKF